MIKTIEVNTCEHLCEWTSVVWNSRREVTDSKGIFTHLKLPYCKLLSPQKTKMIVSIHTFSNSFWESLFPHIPANNGRYILFAMYSLECQGCLFFWDCVLSISSQRFSKSWSQVQLERSSWVWDHRDLLRISQGALWALGAYSKGDQDFLPEPSYCMDPQRSSCLSFHVREEKRNKGEFEHPTRPTDLETVL